VKTTRRGFVAGLLALLPASWVKAKPIDDHQEHVEAHTSAMRYLADEMPIHQFRYWYYNSKTGKYTPTGPNAQNWK
jgi:hypothetical protein